MKFELYHHGILGQKWGVRRTKQQLNNRKANKSISLNNMDFSSTNKIIKSGKDFTLSRNDKLYRATNTKRAENGRLYVTAKKEDAYVYGSNMDYIGGTSNANTYIKTYSLKKDMKIAGVNSQLKTLSRITGNDLNFDDPYSEKGLNVRAKYADVMNKNTPLRSNFIKELTANGYDAVVDMVDSHSKTGIGFASTPLVVLNSETLIGKEYVEKYFDIDKGYTKD